MLCTVISKLGSFSCVDVELVSLEGVDEEEMEKTVISSCYSKITVSSNDKNLSG